MNYSIKYKFLLAVVLVSNLHSFGKINEKTQGLYNKLYNRVFLEKSSKLYFGHQNCYVEGVGWKYDFNASTLPETLPDSDIFKVSGKQPMVFGIDFNEIGDWNLKHIQRLIRLHSERGGITTVSWHIPNPLVDEVSTSNTLKYKTVKQILVNNAIRLKFYKKLDVFIDFLKSIQEIPIIFRPFHEQNGTWFWWGKGESDTKTEEFISLWKITIDYLRDKGVDNILIAYSPTFPLDKKLQDFYYLEDYPGDNYVDILGIDFYFLNPSKMLGDALKNYYYNSLFKWKKFISEMQKIALTKKKIIAITEIGNEEIKIDKFWTDFFAWPLQKEGIRQIDPNYLPLNFAYVLLWRNAFETPRHFYAPYVSNWQNMNFKLLLEKNFLEFLK